MEEDAIKIFAMSLRKTFDSKDDNNTCLRKLALTRRLLMKARAACVEEAGNMVFREECNGYGNLREQEEEHSDPTEQMEVEPRVLVSSLKQPNLILHTASETPTDMDMDQTPHDDNTALGDKSNTASQYLQKQLLKMKHAKEEEYFEAGTSSDLNNVAETETIETDEFDVDCLGAAMLHVEEEEFFDIPEADRNNIDEINDQYFEEAVMLLGEIFESEDFLDNME